MSTKNCVYIYDGEGASEVSKLHLKHSLVENLSTRYNVQFISPDEILKGTWTRDAAVMAFGGGFDKGFIRTLGSVGVAKIRSYVLNGGKYLGICAGGYFGCDYIEFDKGGQLEVCGERHLKFFPGCGRGPVYPGFKYDDLKGSMAAPIDFQTSGTTREIIFTYFHGGGCFLLNESRHIQLTRTADWNERLDPIRNNFKPSLEDYKHFHDKGFGSNHLRPRTVCQIYDRTFDNGGITGSLRDSDLATKTGQNYPKNNDDYKRVSVTEGNSNCTTTTEDKNQKSGLGQASGERSEPMALNLNHDILSDPQERNTGPTSGVSELEILSRYCEIPGTPPAIIKSRVGQGRAILCGVHIEYIPRLLLEMEPTLKELVKTLEDTEKQRLDCFRSLLQQLDLKMK
ncbi:hypothetical protein LOTGIDRAFT_227820 [Lottia gigantea]|uniref:Biotin-protein ligase N-terminal domain-containing protein n=1 Tax=Lottia gigantea TaxID=225164 RepID=V4BGU1_LOTGI|nr:hypothetical protein LOTGIDRAFT_227820 [Lottia gigantea]ESP05127.1 hypothetical protein LOTGIDRAFT_227820 [Lottia gigantea]